MANTIILVIMRDDPQLDKRCINAGKIWYHFQAGVILNTSDNAVHTVAPAGVCAIGYRCKLRFQATKATNGVPQGLFYFIGTRWKKFERNVNLPPDLC